MRIEELIIAILAQGMVWLLFYYMSWASAKLHATLFNKSMPDKDTLFKWCGISACVLSLIDTLLVIYF